MKPIHSFPNSRVQLHRAISKLGWGSRKQAWEWIIAAQIRVDGKVVTDPLTWIDLGRQRVTRAGEEASLLSIMVVALNKPRGVVTTRRDERGRKTVYDLLPPNLPWLHPAGRLDADSEGLLVLTNDSALSTRLTDPEQHVPKTYHVTLRGQISSESTDHLRAGVNLHDGRTRPARVRLLTQGENESEIEIVLTEGRNRQIRRMTAAVGHRVRRLIRVAIGWFPLAALREKDWKVLTVAEQKRLFAE